MKRFLKSLLWFLPALLIFAGLSAYEDPANLLHAGEMANSVLQINENDQNAVMPENYSDRMIAKRRIEAYPYAPDAAALGSSRVIQISSEMLPWAKAFVNTGVTGGVLGDAAALWESWRAEGKVPGTVIVETDQWFLDEKKLDKRYLTAYGESYSQFCERTLGLDIGYSAPGFLDTAKTLLSVSYFQSSLDALLSGSDTRVKITGTDSVSLPNNALIRPDGSYVYPDGYVYSDYDVFTKRLNTVTGTQLIEISDCAGPDPALLSLYEALLRDIKASGARPVVLLSPYHPSIYDAVVSDKEMFSSFFEIDFAIRSLCERLGVEVVGSFSPYECGFLGADFIDALHLTQDATARLAAEISPS